MSSCPRTLTIACPAVTVPRSFCRPPCPGRRADGDAPLSRPSFAPSPAPLPPAAGSAGQRAPRTLIEHRWGPRACVFVLSSSWKARWKQASSRRERRGEPTPLKPLWENGEEVVAVGIPGFLQVQVSSLDAKMVTCKRELAKRRRPVRRTGNSFVANYLHALREPRLPLK